MVAVVAAVGSGSVALLGFGVDSFVESISGSVLIWRLGSERRGTADEEAIERIERRAEQIVGVSFFALAAYIAFDAVTSLINQERPQPSAVGIGLAAVSIGVMLWLARAKRQTAADLGSRALAADAEQTQACWYLVGRRAGRYRAQCALRLVVGRSDCRPWCQRHSRQGGSGGLGRGGT